MFLTLGYVLIVCVLVKSGFIHTIRSDFSGKKGNLGWHVVRDFRRDVFWQRVLQNASLLYLRTGKKLLSMKVSGIRKLTVFYLDLMVCIFAPEGLECFI